MEGFKKVLALVAVGVTLLLIVSAYVDEDVFLSPCAKADTLASVANWASGEVWVVDPESPTELEVQDGIARCAAAAGPESLANMIMMPIMYQVDIASGRVKVVTDSDPVFLRFVMLLAQ